MNKVIEIFRSWGISYDHTNEQSDLAAARMRICDDCSFKATKPIIHCTECMCPLQKKVFSPRFGACRIGKWDITDKQYKSKE